MGIGDDGEKLLDQVHGIIRAAMEWTDKSAGPLSEAAGRGREYARSIASLLATEGRRVLSGIGLATTEDLEKVQRRVEALEDEKPAPAKSKRAPLKSKPPVRRPRA